MTNKIEELHSTVLCNNPKLDACGFSETFSTDLVEDCRLEVEGYTMNRRDRLGKLGGGLLVYISYKWNSTRRNDIESHNIETIWLEIILIY